MRAIIYASPVPEIHWQQYFMMIGNGIEDQKGVASQCQIKQRQLKALLAELVVISVSLS